MGINMDLVALLLLEQHLLMLAEEVWGAAGVQWGRGEGQRQLNMITKFQSEAELLIFTPGLYSIHDLK